MKQIKFTVRLIALLAFVCFGASLANAQATRTWVSGVGDDVNPCSRTAPCKTFAGAISKTATNGVINCLDHAAYSNVTITKSITIDCHEVYAGILNGTTTGIIINYDSFAPADARKSVRLRNLNIDGGDTGTNGIRILGTASAGSVVSVEDCSIDGNYANPGRGISDQRGGGGKLFVSNTTIRNMSGTGLSLDTPGAAPRIDWTITNVRIFNCGYGIAIGSNSRVIVNDSVISGCTNAGLYAEGPFGASELHAENTISTNNGTGVNNAGGATIRLSNDTITYNATGINGATSSYGNNRIASNTVVGTAPTAIGPASSEFGLQ